MGYSEDALRFATIPTGEQVRFSDRISFAYLDRAKIVQSETGVVAIDERARRAIAVPASSIAVVALGPGTSITHAAAASITACGATIIWTGGEGYRLYAAGTPLTSSARWAQAQARMWAHRPSRVAAAKALYLARFPDHVLPGNVRIATLRALEGAEVKAAYRRLAKSHGVSFKRDTKNEDPVNTSLNIANGILYGLAASVCASLGLSPALGVIHEGNAKAFLFDLADAFKLETSVPAAFETAKEDDPVTAVRRSLRRRIRRGRVMDRMLGLTMRILEPHLREDAGDRLIDDREDGVEGHTNYGTEA